MAMLDKHREYRLSDRKVGYFDWLMDRWVIRSLDEAAVPMPVYRNERGLVVGPEHPEEHPPRPPQYPRLDASGPYIVWVELYCGMAGDTWWCESYDTLAEARAAAAKNEDKAIVTMIVGDG